MKFFNSDKSGFLSFVAKRKKALFALFFIIAGTSSVWGQSFYVVGNGDGSRGNWCDGQSWIATSSQMTQQGSIYVKQFENLPANNDYQFKIVRDGNWYSGQWGMSNYNSYSDNTNLISGSVSCSDGGSGNIKFSLSQTANVTVAFDFTNNRVAVYSSSVEIGLVGSFTNNWNLEQQIMGTTGDGVSYTWDLSSSDISLNNSDEFKFISGTSRDNNNNQWGGPLGGAYTIPPSASTDGTIYNVDIIVHHKDCGNVKFDAPLCPVTIQKIELNVLTNDLKITTGESSTEPDPEPVSLYLIGAGTGAQWNLADALPFTYENGVYTWTGELTVNNEAFKILTSNKGWEPAYVAETDKFEVVPGKDIDLYYREKLGENQYTCGDNKFKITSEGEYTITVTLEADNSGSMIVTKKSDPVYSATITADASASQQTARQVTLTSLLTEAAAGTDLTSATCQFQYLSADAAEGTEYSNLDAPVAYNADGTSLTTTALLQGGKYLFRAVWTLNGEVVATSEPSEATCVYPIWPEPEMFDVVWIPTYNTSDGSVTITAEISAKEDACFVMGQIVGLVANIFVDNLPQATSMSNPSGAENNKATATATIQNVNEGQELAYRLELTTGASQQVLGRGGIQIPGGTYVVEAPEVHNSTVYLRGDINGWAYDGIDDKYVGKTYDDVNVFWDWSGSPVEFVTTGESGGSKFKFDDATDGAWGDEQWNNGSSDAWIGEEQISDNKATFTAIKGNQGDLGNFWILPNICPATISRIDLNVETNQLVITFDSYKKEFKDLWFRSPIVEGGWGDGISDPLASGVNPKYQGQTSDGVVYVWNWSGSNAVTIEAGTNFKFGEYTGNASWGNAGYGGAGDSDKNLQSSSFGQTLSIVQASGNEFIPQEKITITGITLDTENMTVVFEGESYVERFPVTVNTVNGEAGGAVVTEPADIGNMAIGETLTVTATANEGYVALFEATSGCVMTDGSADNIKVFEITEANPEITVTFQVQCETVEPGFAISGQFNAEILDADGLYQGSPVVSGEADPADGYWSDGARYIQLTANSVTANYFDWVCTGHAIDGEDQEKVPVIAWTDQGKTSARAELSLPGTYTFVCKAKCNETDEWTNSAELTITAPAPEMGFDGPGFEGSTWSHASAGVEGQGLMTRQAGTMIWKSRVLNVANFGGEFVVIQRYKTLGCNDLSENSTDESSRGWTGNNECGDMGLTRGDNKLNRAETLQFINVVQPGDDSNFQTADGGGWITGVNGTQLQLVVTMTGTDSYTVALEEVSQECTTPADNFAISAQLNQGAGAPFEGNLVASGSNTATGGYFADDYRTVTLSTSQVADNYEWVCEQYAIDGTLQTVNIADVVTINNFDQQIATATLNLPGDYTFRCKAKCAADVDFKASGTVTISVYPEMGFDGPITTWGWEDHSVASSSGIMTREIGSLVWKKDFVCATNAGEGENPYEFVVIQQYKNGCEVNQGWAGHEECDLNGAKYNNKINDSDIDRTAGSVVFAPNHGTNFIPSPIPAAGSNLTLYVEMTGFDSYKVWLAVDVKLKSSVATEGEPENPAKGGTLSVKSGELAFDNGDDLSEYVGQEFTISANPNESKGYKLKSITINGTTYTSSGDRVVTLTNAGLEVSAVFTLDCITPMEYTVTGGGKYCSDGGYATVNLSYSQSGINYTLYNGDEQPVASSTREGTGSSLSWHVSTDGTYTVKAIDKKTTCSGQSPVVMSGSASVTSVSSVEINASPSSKISIYQPKTYTTEDPVVWSYSVAGSGSLSLITMSKSEKEWVVKATGATTDINYYTITAKMKSPNQNCQSTVTLKVDNVVPWVCDPGKAGLPTSTNGE